MPNYGFAIDLRKCIGCHACTIACKAEHDIPVGVNRCWVKTVEQGTFPDTRRFFFPVLCNQCDEAPCAKICPTNALFKRRDGIVDLHGDSCIGCRACMVACPYDQLFIDPNTHTAEKCNFCANRVENELLPACVSVCPTECRIFGDLDDPSSEVAQIAAREMTRGAQAGEGHDPEGLLHRRRRRVIMPEIATRPFMYKEGQVLLRPLGSPDADPSRPGDAARRLRHAAQEAVGRRHGALPADQGHRHRHDAASSLLLPFVSATPSPLTTIVGPAISLVFLLITAGAARRRPRSARALLLHPHPPELGIVDGVGRILPDRAGAADDAVARRRRCSAPARWLPLLRWPLVVCSILTTGYTGFLFAQGLARDLWQGWQSTVDLLRAGDRRRLGGAAARVADSGRRRRSAVHAARWP